MQGQNDIILTIVTVCYNAIKDIKPTIESVLPFINKHVEYIIMDGGSTDGTLNIIEQYIRENILLFSEADKGIYDAMNKAIRKANGKWLIFINCGDKLSSLPKELFLQHYDDYSCIFASVEVDNGRVVKPTFNWMLKIRNGIPHQGLFYNIKKDFVCFDLKYGIFGDYDYNLKLWKRKANVYVVKDIVAFHSLRGISNDKEKATEELFSLIRQYGGPLYVCLSFAYFKWNGLKMKLGI